MRNHFVTPKPLKTRLAMEHCNVMGAGKSSRVHRQYKTKYQIRNWREYERGLRSRSDVTIWLSEEAIAAWIPPKNGVRGGQRRYSNLAIRTTRHSRAGIVKLTHHKLRQPQYMGNEAHMNAQCGGLIPQKPVSLTMPSELWDVILVDCPPSLGLLTVSALCAAREVLVPVEVSSMALAGLAGVIQTVDRVRDRLNPDLAVSEILVCRADARTNLSREVLERLRERFGKLVMNTVVRETVRLREA